MLQFILCYFLVYLHPDPRNIPRLLELERIAQDIASTEATAAEAQSLAAIAIHESNAHLRAIGRDGSVGPFQINGGSPSAAEALQRMRWSIRMCGDLSLYAGCSRCGACRKGLLGSLTDPSLPRQ